ncbi:MAG: hypothetical protein ABW168_22330 [Sedimenticola sp.]
MNQVRPPFQCWKCEREFRQSIDLEGEPVLMVECPYCGAVCVVDLNPYRTPGIDPLRNTSATLETHPEYELPECIPTTQPQESISEPEG